MIVVGIDIGGSGIKGAPVDVVRGEPVAERLRIPTPQPSTPEACAGVVAEIVDRLDIDGPFGCTVPAIVRRGTVLSAANIDLSWVGVEAETLFRTVTGRPVTVLNDADAAGLAEARFGAAAGRRGTVLVLTLGTGIGSALLHDGVLVPNFELGHLEFKGGDAEHYISGKLRNDLDWPTWSRRLDEYLAHVAFTLGPDLIVLGGGVSKDWEHFADRIDPGVEVVPAALRNRAGLVGAALAAAEGDR